MLLPLIDGIEVDLNDDLDLYFFHEYLQWKNYSFNRVDKKGIREKINLSAFQKVYMQRANTGGWNFAEEDVYKFDEVRFELPNECKTICISKKDNDYETLIIQLASLSGHGSRLTQPFSSTSESIYNTNADIIVINEDPLRFPEFLYPSCYMLGCSERLHSMKLMADDVRRIITEKGKQYKNIVVYSDSKHAGSGLSFAIELSDIVTHCFTVHGTNTHDFDESPIVKDYLANYKTGWYTSPAQWMHIVKCYQYKNRFEIPDHVLNPLKHIKNYNIKVDYYHGKYDDEYRPFLKYAQELDTGISYHEVDYRTRYETHNIRNHIDRKILPGYINEI